MFNKSAAQEIMYKMAEELLDEETILDQEAIDAAIDQLISAANLLDKGGLTKTANNIDNILKKLAKDKKPPKGAKHRAPKGWFDKMKKKIKKDNPDYAKNKINAIVGDIWYNKLSNKKRVEIYKEYGETKNPNK